MWTRYSFTWGVRISFSCKFKRGKNSDKPKTWTILNQPFYGADLVLGNYGELDLHSFCSTQFDCWTVYWRKNEDLTPHSYWALNPPPVLTSFYSKYKIHPSMSCFVGDIFGLLLYIYWWCCFWSGNFDGVLVYFQEEIFQCHSFWLLLVMCFDAVTYNDWLGNLLCSIVWGCDFYWWCCAICWWLFCYEILCVLYCTPTICKMQR